MKILTCRWRKQFLFFLLLACLLYILIGLFIVSKFPREESTQNSLSFRYADSLGINAKSKQLINETPQDNSKLSNFQNVEEDFTENHINDNNLIIRVESKLSYNVHIFYYPWYGNPDHDGKYYHWNHPYLPHWNKDEAKKYQTGTHVPPDDIGANFYPQLGPYSSSDPNVIHKHMAQMQKAGVGVCVVSWYPSGQADNEGKEPDSLIPELLDISALYRIKIAFHIEPYKGRSPETWRDNIKYILDKYGDHESFYRHYDKMKKKHLPVYYIYDSYNIPPGNWAQIFQSNGAITVRNTDLDGIFIGLFVERQHKSDLIKAGFDGFYSYFATDRFSYGSTWGHWREIMKYAKERNKIFIPSIGPGYIDTRIRPWNAKNIRNRDNGSYYMSATKFACDLYPEFLSITSFNEWHEGTQIEPATKKKVEDLYYLDYGSQGPSYYLELTRKIVDIFLGLRRK
ncbi:glycoprotein endo-alpha-1,2-mannosidase-like [Mytilus galloprovincialis]|uniref:glycoprotein endo-alpha-1,2-mannosidase-like n=1 Tax=Mytilus galloprovincialis TaxID=29158 RepID=UPI003F7B6A18